MPQATSPLARPLLVPLRRVPAGVARLVAATVLLSTLAGCDGDDAPEFVDPGPIVGVLELAVSLRHQDAAPNNASRIETTPTELRVDGRKIIDLERGMVPAAERSNDAITKLVEALRGGPARRSAGLRLHVNTPWQTTTLVLASLEAANVHEVGFEVRPPGGGATTGWIVIDDFRVEPATNDPVELQGPAQRNWNDLVAVWEEAYQGCRRDHYVDCAPAPVTAAPGGKLEIRFFSRGSALKIELTRFGVVDEERPAGQPQMIEGLAAPPPAAGDEVPLPPVTHGAFTWRFDAATDELSPISAAMRPLCGARPCGVVLTGDPDTMTLRLLSLVGSAFPNGTEAPSVVFLIPRS